MPRNRAFVLLTFMLCAAGFDAILAPRALAQDDLLAGPKVPADSLKSAVGRPTIVHRNFDGELERAGAEPGRAALEAMRDAGGNYALDATELAALDATITARSVAFDALIRDNYDAIITLSTLGPRATSPNALVRVGALADLTLAMNRFDSYFKRGNFIDEIARVEGVRAERVAQAREIEKRYIDTLLRDALKTEPGNARGKEIGIRIRLRLEHFGALLKEAIEAKVQFGSAEFDRFASEIDLDAVQREKALAVLGPLFIAELAKNATPQMRLKVFSEIYAICTPDQRRALLSYIAANKALKKSAQDGTAAETKAVSP